MCVYMCACFSKGIHVYQCCPRSLAPPPTITITTTSSPAPAIAETWRSVAIDQSGGRTWETPGARGPPRYPAPASASHNAVAWRTGSSSSGGSGGPLFRGVSREMRVYPGARRGVTAAALSTFRTLIKDYLVIYLLKQSSTRPWPLH